MYGSEVSAAGIVQTETLPEEEHGETEEEPGLYTTDGQWILMIPDDDEAGYIYYSFEEDGNLRMSDDTRSVYMILEKQD